jgi:hypothetical protein
LVQQSLLRLEFQLSSLLRRLSLSPRDLLRVSRDGIRALQNAFLRIFFIDERGNTLVAALVSIDLAHDIERVGPFSFAALVMASFTSGWLR